MELGGRCHAPAASPPVPIVQEAGWAPGFVWTGTENLALTGGGGFEPRTVQGVVSHLIY